VGEEGLGDLRGKKRRGRERVSNMMRVYQTSIDTQTVLLFVVLKLEAGERLAMGYISDRVECWDEGNVERKWQEWNLLWMCFSARTLEGEGR